MDASEVPAFERSFFGSDEPVSAIGGGRLGGKATGLTRAAGVLARRRPARDLLELALSVPRLVVVATDVFDRFMDQNRLWDVAFSGESDEVIAFHFQKASLPAEVLGDLRSIAQEVRSPIAVRSSSLLEDARERPFAGVYATKMTPNNESTADVRFQRLAEAIKLVYASTFFRAALSYRATTSAGPRDEKMAVILQEIVGRRHGDRYYPDVSGVARSYSFYRSGRTRPEDGVVELALGLGKTIVDGGRAWAYSPAHPRLSPPYGGIGELLKRTQTTFWAVQMGHVPVYDPVRETEFLVEAQLADAEADGTLRLLASTYDTQSDRIAPGIDRKGPRLLNFAPLLVLEEVRLNALVKALLKVLADELSGPVEIEFALTLDSRREPVGRFGFLQVRPMAVSAEVVDLSAGPLAGWAPLVRADSVLGNGTRSDIRDVVYVRPGTYEAGLSQQAAADLAQVNRTLSPEGRPYLLIGFGRWGSSDPWLGIPVGWGDVSGARAIVETSLPGRPVEMSQGSHFFHNLASFEVSYFSLPDEAPAIDWAFLESHPAAAETGIVRHVRLDAPLRVAVDGRSGRGVILRRVAS